KARCTQTVQRAWNRVYTFSCLHPQAVSNRCLAYQIRLRNVTIIADSVKAFLLLWFMQFQAAYWYRWDAA
ncbi:MAG: hypothetical protein ACFNLD_07995, partial [Kingella oralis]